MSDKKVFIFTWRVKNFNFFNRIYCERLCSPVFRIDSLNNSEWKLCLFPKTTSELECRLQCCSFIQKYENDGIDVNYRYQLESSDGAILTSSKLFSETFRRKYYSEPCKLVVFYDLMKEISTWHDDTLIVRCQLTRKSDVLPTDVSSSLVYGTEAETEIICNKPLYMCIFKFSNFENWLQNKQINLITPSGMSLIEVTFRYVNGQIQIKIASNVEDDWTHCFTGDVELVDLVGKQIIYGDFSNIYFSKGNKIAKFPNLISKRHLEEADCFVREEMRLKFHIIYLYSFISEMSYCSIDLKSGRKETLPNTVTECGFSSSDTTETSNDTCFLQEHFQNFRIGENFPDAKVRIGNDIFHVHKCLLASQSTVLSTMFEKTLKNSDTDIIDIDDVEANTLKYFLEFMYKETLNELKDETALDLLVFAHKYQVLQLVEKCTIFLKSSLSPGNVCKILYTADLINDEGLKAFSTNYIVVNSFKVLSAPEWITWAERNAYLATEVLLSVSKQFEGIA